MTTVKRVFQVDGKPFFPIGGQACNSSGYNAAEAEQAFKITKMINGNTLEIPVYWEQVEPKEGKFDFTAVDELLAGARRYETKLILLWFASWKNGNMDYAPKWVKTDTKRFKRVKAESGKDVWDLSSHCKANMEADKKAFVALCKHLKAKDGAERTVIAIQIENEQGIIGSDRDYGPEAQAEFDRPVPAKLVAAMKKAGCGRIFDIWQQSGAKKSGTWPEMFGWQAGELMTAWSIASYVDNIAAAAKAAYDIVLYTNVWLMEQHAWVRAGESYPSGGGVSKVLDIYKWYTPHLDIIAPDNYELDAKGFAEVCANYAREDNPLFVIESNTGLNMFRNIADYNAVGYFTHYEQNEDGSLFPEEKRRIDNVRCVAAVIPLLLKYQGTGKVQAIIEEEPVKKRGRAQRLDFDGYMGLAEFNGSERGGGLVFQVSRHEFYFVGVNYKLMLRPKPVIGQTPVTMLGGVDLTHGNFYNFFVRVCEGHFNAAGEYVVDRRRNGDAARGGITVGGPDCVMQLITSD